MEIILKKDVEGVGFKDDIVTVKNGFGRNFLIPNGSAILATPSAKKVLAENIKQQVVKDKKIIDDANKLAKKINSLEIKIKAKHFPTDKKWFVLLLPPSPHSCASSLLLLAGRRGRVIFSKRVLV